MTEKPKEIKKCPFCNSDDSVYLITRKFTHIPNNKDYVLSGNWWYYKCRNCIEEFTTTESDTLSIDNLKQKKL